MAELCSAAWFEELAERLAHLEPVGDAGSTRLRLGQVVTDVADAAWTIELGAGAPNRLVMGVDDADVVLVEDLDALRRLRSGVPNAQLWREGAIKLRGDVTALLRASDLLGVLAEVLGTESPA